MRRRLPNSSSRNKEVEAVAAASNAVKMDTGPVIVPPLLRDSTEALVKVDSESHKAKWVGLVNRMTHSSAITARNSAIGAATAPSQGRLSEGRIRVASHTNVCDITDL